MAVTIDTSRCLACLAPSLIQRINFGLQPLCNRLLAAPDAEDPKFPRTLVQCQACGLLQFDKLIPPDELRPRTEAARFGEPESHLDDMVAGLVESASLQSGDLVVGLSYKDASILERFEKSVSARPILLDISRDLGDTSAVAGIETIQDLLDVGHAQEFANRHGRARMVIARHLLEHVQDFGRFAAAMSALLAEDGVLVVEEPDFSIPLAENDYSTIWEERSVFFTPATLHSTLARMGFSQTWTKTYPYPLENALVAAARYKGDSTTKDSAADELRVCEIYSDSYPGIRCTLRDRLHALTNDGGLIAMFGAGHMACNFINLLDLRDCFAFAIDDHPKKSGMFLPGSHIPILPSSALEERDVRLCVLSVRPELEKVIMDKFPAYRARGGQFASILPRRPISLGTGILSS